MPTKVRPTVPNAAPIAAVGDRVYTYDGPGTVVRIRENDTFYGGPVMIGGEYVTERPWDGVAYFVKCDNGNMTIFDRSRIRKGV